MMRWGLLSTANINRKLLGGAQETDEAAVVAVASRDRSRAEGFAREHGIERAHGSYEALLEDLEVDAVYNPLPNSLHVPWTVRALEAGKHVLCEKPLTRRPAEAEQAFAAAERAGRVLEEAFMWRHHPQALRLRALLDEGVVGRLRMVKASFSFPLTDVSDIRMQSGLDGGSLMDVGCYCLSGVRLAAGAEPERVHAEQVIGGDGVDVAFAATLRFPDDVIGQFHCGFSVGRRHHLEAIGDEASLFLADPWHGVAPGIEIRRDEGVERIEIEAANPYAYELADFARAARGEDALRLGAADALAQARGIDALYRAAESGSAVAL
jgi:predicted dehydrogenase